MKGFQSASLHCCMQVSELTQQVSSLQSANDMIANQLHVTEAELDKANQQNHEGQLQLVRLEQKLTQYRRDKYKLLEQMDKKDRVSSHAACSNNMHNRLLYHHMRFLLKHNAGPTA